MRRVQPWGTLASFCGVVVVRWVTWATEEEPPPLPHAATARLSASAATNTHHVLTRRGLTGVRSICTDTYCPEPATVRAGPGAPALGSSARMARLPYVDPGDAPEPVRA